MRELRYECTFILYFFSNFVALNYFPILIHLLKEMAEEAKLVNLTIKKQNIFIFVHMHALLIHFISVSSIEL